VLLFFFHLCTYKILESNLLCFNVILCIYETKGGTLAVYGPKLKQTRNVESYSYLASEEAQYSTSLPIIKYLYISDCMVSYGIRNFVTSL
jgi:hypothetical protein